MEEKVQNMLKLIEEDGDSFAKRAEMYYKRRPELIGSVEETYRAFKALADRYDLLSKELQNANHTIATVFPEQVQFSMDEDDDLPTPKLPKKAQNSTNAPKVPKAPIENLQGLISTASKQFQAKKAPKPQSKNKLVVKSGLCKEEALAEIDRLHKEILGLQTVKEFVKSSYEAGLAKYWELENQIMELQDKVSKLQDEFDVESLIEDNEARTLMAEAALKSCQETLAILQEKQEKSTREAQEEFKKIEAAREILTSLRKEYIKEEMDEQKPSQDEKVESEMLAKDVGDLIQESKEIDPVQKKTDLGSMASLTVTELAEKIDELVNKVISLETAVSSQTVLINTLRTESDDLHAQIRNLEDEKESLIGDTHNLNKRLKEMEEKLNRLQDLNRNVESQSNNLQSSFSEARSSLDHLSVKLTTVKPDEEVEENEAKSSSEQKLPEQDLPKQKLSEQKLPEQELPQQKLSEQKLPEQEFPQQKLSEQKLPEQELPEQKLSEQKMPEQKLPDQKLPEQKLPEQKLPEQKLPEQKLPEQELPEQKLPEQKLPEQKLPEQELPEQKLPEQELPEQKLQEQKLPEQKLPEQELPEQKLLEQKLPEQKLPESTLSEQKLSEIKKSKEVQPPAVSETSSSISKTEDVKDVKEVEIHVQTTELSSLLKQEEDQKPVKKTVKFLDEKPKELVPVDYTGEPVKSELAKSEARRDQTVKEVDDLSWQQMLLSGTEDREKILLKEYTAILRNYKDVKKKLNDTEKKEKECQFDITLQMSELKEAIIKRDHEIHLLRQKLNQIQRKDATEAGSSSTDRSVNPEIGSEDLDDFDISKDDEVTMVFRDPTPTMSAVEEKLRMAIDAILEENLDFWLRFSTSFHQVQKFKSAVQDLQDEISKLKDKTKKDGSVSSQLKSEARPIYKHLREIQTELTVWLEQSSSLKEELKRRSASLCNIQEEITVALKEGVEEDEIRFSTHQVQHGIEKTLRQLNEEFGISNDQPQLHHNMSRSRVPLRSFIFGTRAKKQKHSLFSFMHPNRKFHVVRTGVPMNE